MLSGMKAHPSILSPAQLVLGDIVTLPSQVPWRSKTIRTMCAPCTVTPVTLWHKRPPPCPTTALYKHGLLGNNRFCSSDPMQNVVCRFCAGCRKAPYECESEAN